MSARNRGALAEKRHSVVGGYIRIPTWREAFRGDRAYVLTQGTPCPPLLCRAHPLKALHGVIKVNLSGALGDAEIIAEPMTCTEKFRADDTHPRLSFVHGQLARQTGEPVFH